MPNLAISVHVELNVQVELECSSLDAPLNSADQSICGAAGELAGQLVMSVLVHLVPENRMGRTQKR